MNLVWNRYGSHDSIDEDICVYLDELPNGIEDRKELTNQIKKSNFNPNSNLIIAKIENGQIIDCTKPKSSPDSLNNAVYLTYNLHKQEHPLQIWNIVKRNLPLAIYKTWRLIATYLARTEYRTLLRPTMNWQFQFVNNLDKLRIIDWTTINTFNQKNVTDTDIWKGCSFYLAQNMALLQNLHIHTKEDAIRFNPNLAKFINRQPIMVEDRIAFSIELTKWIELVLNLDWQQNGEFLKSHKLDQICNIKNETVC